MSSYNFKFCPVKKISLILTREILLLLETARLFLQEAILKKFLQLRVPTVVLDHELLYPSVWSNRFSEGLGGRGRIAFKGNQCSGSCVHLTWESTNIVGIAGRTLDFWRSAELSGWSKHAYRNWGSVFAFYQDYQVSEGKSCILFKLVTIKNNLQYKETWFSISFFFFFPYSTFWKYFPNIPVKRAAIYYAVCQQSDFIRVPVFLWIKLPNMIKNDKNHLTW